MIEKELLGLVTKGSEAQSVDKATAPAAKRGFFVRFWIGLLALAWLSYLLMSYSESLALFLLGGLGVTAVVGLLAQIECYVANFSTKSTQRVLYSKSTDAKGVSVPSNNSSPMDNPIHINTLGAYAAMFDNDDIVSSDGSSGSFSD